MTDDMVDEDCFSSRTRDIRCLGSVLGCFSLSIISLFVLFVPTATKDHYFRLVVKGS
jgi:hypothetical protein